MMNISAMIKDMPKENMLNMSALMRDMSIEMSKMSEIVDKGTATDEEMKTMHERMTKMQKTFSEIMKK
jgi:hypothetical protein